MLHGTTMTCPDCGADAELVTAFTQPAEGFTYLAHIYHCPECGIDILDEDMKPDEAGKSDQ